MNETVAIIILNYNNFEDTINCIESIIQHNTFNIKIIIVDNASSRPHVIESLDEYFSKKFVDNYLFLREGEDTRAKIPYITFFVSGVNDGYACGNNKGLNLAFLDEDITHIMVINNDVLFTNDIIPSLVKYCDNTPGAGLLSPILYKKGGVEIDYNCARKNQSALHMILRYLMFDKPWLGIKSRILNRQYILKQHPEYLNESAVPIELPSGSCMLASKKTWLEIGGFDPNTFLYYEEAILYKKLSQINKTNFLLPHLKCIHLGAQSTSKSRSLKFNLKTFQSTLYYSRHYAANNVIVKYLLIAIVYLNYFALRTMSLFKE